MCPYMKCLWYNCFRSVHLSVCFPTSRSFRWHHWLPTCWPWLGFQRTLLGRWCFTNTSCSLYFVIATVFIRHSFIMTNNQISSDLIFLHLILPMIWHLRLLFIRLQPLWFYSKDLLQRVCYSVTCSSGFR